MSAKNPTPKWLREVMEDLPEVNLEDLGCKRNGHRKLRVGKRILTVAQTPGSSCRTSFNTKAQIRRMWRAQCLEHTSP